MPCPQDTESGCPERAEAYDALLLAEQAEQLAGPLPSARAIWGSALLLLAAAAGCASLVLGSRRSASSNQLDASALVVKEEQPLYQNVGGSTDGPLFEAKYCSLSEDENLPQGGDGELGRQPKTQSLEDCRSFCCDTPGCKYFTFTKLDKDCLVYGSCPSSRQFGDGSRGTATYSEDSCEIYLPGAAAVSTTQSVQVATAPPLPAPTTTPLPTPATTVTTAAPVPAPATTASPTQQVAAEDPVGWDPIDEPAATTKPEQVESSTVAPESTTMAPESTTMSASSTVVPELTTTPKTELLATTEEEEEEEEDEEEEEEVEEETTPAATKKATAKTTARTTTGTKTKTTKTKTKTKTTTTKTATTTTTTLVCPKSCTPKEKVVPDIVIPFFERDLCKLKYTAKSLGAHDPNRNLGNVYLMWVSTKSASDYEDDLAEVVETLSKTRKVNLIDFSVAMNSYHLDGWHAQQLLKLKIASAVQSEFYLVMDSKNTLIKDIEDDTFFNKCNQAKVFSQFNYTKIPSPHNAWYEKAAETLGVKPPLDKPFPASITPILLHRKTVLDMLAHVGEGSGLVKLCDGPLCPLFGVGDATGQGTTEFTMYNMFLYTKTKLECTSRPELHSPDSQDQWGLSLWRGVAENKDQVMKENMDTLRNIYNGSLQPIMFGSQPSALDDLSKKQRAEATKLLEEIYEDAGVYKKGGGLSVDELIDCAIGSYEYGKNEKKFN